MAKSKNETQNTEDQTTENNNTAGIVAPAVKSSPDMAKDTAVTQTENALVPLAELAQTHRVPTWQQAALHRLMDWEDGKLVTDAEYQSALARLSGRRMGGM